MTFAFVLVEPQRAANVGSAARALKNFGFDDLRLVRGVGALPGEAEHAEARALAWNSADVLETARRFDTLEEAVADLHLVAATSSRGLEGETPSSPRDLARAVGALPPESRAGCVFGPEASGLTNEQLVRTTLRVRIPTLGEQPSLNLAQAVVLVAYEISLAATAVMPSDSVRLSDATLRLADAASLERTCASFVELGTAAGYLNPQAPEHVCGELRRLLARANPTEREATLLLGLLAQIRWAVARGRPDTGVDP